MIFKSFKKYVSDNTLYINEPGLIYNVLPKKYGHSDSKRRIMFVFEDILVNIQSESRKKIGLQKTEELLYCIGKDVGYRYLIQGNIRKIPSFLIPTLLDFIFTCLRGGGMSFAEDMKCNIWKKRLIVNGKNNIICRKTSMPGFFVGLVSGIFSCLVGENIEGKSGCKCPGHCQIIADKNLPEKYLPDLNNLKPMKDFIQYNFPKEKAHNLVGNSLEDLMRFKKIILDETGKLIFDNKSILSVAIDFLGLFVYHFSRIGRLDILEDSVIKGAEDMAHHLLTGSDNNSKIKKIITILSAFGWGVPHYTKTKDLISFSFLNPPICKFGFLYPALELNGYLNVIFNRKLEIKNIETNLASRIIKVNYNFI